VAEIDGQVVGHIGYSPVEVSDGASGWYALGPLAVAPAFQNQGIGQALVTTGMRELRRRGANGCVLVGEPRFYGRFGFRSDPCCTMEGAPQEYVLSLALERRPQASGKITHHKAFHARGPLSRGRRP
jgi:putative acetyltransferase